MCPAHADTSNFATEGSEINLGLLEFALSGLKDFSFNIKRIGLTGWGEPFMSPDIFSAVDRCHEVCPNASISVTTNGTLFSDRLIDQILGSRITDIAISLDAGSKGTYERIRKGANFERVVEGIRRLVQLRDRCDRKLPKISTNFVLMRSNIHELPDYVRTAISIGVDRIGTVHAHGVYGSDRKEAVYTLLEEESNLAGEDYMLFIREAQTIARHANVEFYVPPLTPTKPGLNCSFNARRFPIIDPSGDVYPCCILQAFGNEREPSVTSMGNIEHENLPDIWKSVRYSRFREAFWIGDLPDPHCIRCPKYYNL
jgi:radical SAM protein with 4Fe4S-binding SPASM domain